MKVIHEAYKNVIGYIGKQEFCEWKEYVESPYIYKKSVDGGEIWYNLFTREMMFLRENEVKSLREGNKNILFRLVKSWFYIPKNVSAKSLVYSFGQSYKSNSTSYVNRKNSRKLSFFTVFTTTECNARCPYCYEYGTAKNTMSMDTAKDVAKYIIKKSAPEIIFKWFGGEPLLNPDVMDYICEQVGNAGIEYASQITTNAYLLDRITDEQLVKLWRTKRLQITVDGTKKEYLKAKKLPEDSYERVLSSIERIARLGIKVTIRTHITKDNLDDLKALVGELNTRYSGLRSPKTNRIKNIFMYASPLFDGFGENPSLRSDEERKIIYDNYIEIDKFINETGICYVRSTPKVSFCHCMADNHDSIVITPAGMLTPCEHCHDREFVGDVWKGGVIPAKWYEKTPEIPKCENCFYYPQCLKLKMCDAEAPCNEDYIRFLKHRQDIIIDTAYKKYLESEKVGSL